MGLIKGGLFVVASVLLFVAFLAGNLFLTFDKSLDYNVVKPEIQDVVVTLITQQTDFVQEIDSKLYLMDSYCTENSEYVFESNEYGQVFVIPCSVISQGTEAIVDYSISSAVENVYYQTYDCDFWDCLKESQYPFFLISKKAQDYWHSKFILSVLAIIGLIVVMFFLAEKKTNLPIVVGGLLVVASLPFMKLDSLLGFFADKYMLNIVSVFFTKSYDVFIISFILGLVILGIGILLKFFKAGFLIKKITSKFSKKPVSKPVKIKKSK